MATHIHVYVADKKKKSKDVARQGSAEQIKKDIANEERLLKARGETNSTRLKFLKEELQKVEVKTGDAGFTTYDPREVARLRSEVKELEDKIKITKSPFDKKDLEQILVKIKKELSKYRDSKNRDALVYNGTEQQWREHGKEMHPGCTFKPDPVKKNIVYCYNKQNMQVGKYDTEKRSGNLED